MNSVKDHSYDPFISKRVNMGCILSIMNQTGWSKSLAQIKESQLDLAHKANCF